jgi:hypothetical protein
MFFSIFLVTALMNWAIKDQVEPSRMAASLLILLIWGLAGVQLFRWSRGTRNRTVEAVAIRWLEERQAFTPKDIKSRTRAIRIASWMPVSCVLLVFLFFPGIWGAISQIARPGPDLPGYEVSIPFTWYVSPSYEPDLAKLFTSAEGRASWGASEFDGFIGTGPVGSPASYRNARVPLSWWRVATLPYGSAELGHKYNPPSDANVIARKEFTIADELLSCYEYRPAMYEQHYGVGQIFVSCGGRGRLRANFLGEPIHVSSFYRVIRRIHPA